MTNKQYTIGEFAAINKISARMLRHYDKLGLFAPSMVLENGYRCYSSEQISTISLIKKYQRCGFTLAEITKLLCSSEEEIAVLAKKKQRQLMAQDFRQNDAQAQLSILSGECVAPLPNVYAVSYTQQLEQLLLCKAAPICEDGIEEAFGVLYDALETSSIPPMGLPLLLSEMDETNTRYRVAVQVSSGTSLAGFDLRTLPAGWYLSTLHHGGYEDIGQAYDRLFCHGKKHNFKLSPLFVERYFLDCTHTPTPADFITEISIKITP